LQLKQPQNGSSEKVGTSAAGPFRHSTAADDSDTSEDDKEDEEGEGHGKLQGTKDANSSTDANNHQEEFEKQQRKISRFFAWGKLIQKIAQKIFKAASTVGKFSIDEN
jgi:hypothetical protein